MLVFYIFVCLYFALSPKTQDAEEETIFRNVLHWKMKHHCFMNSPNNGKISVN